ncbi:hypothetical protein CQA61_29985, partial [Klebsiella pneumoniae]
NLMAVQLDNGGAAMLREKIVALGVGVHTSKATNALKQLGLETQVVEFAPNLMAVQLDNGGAAMLREKIVALGVGVHTSKAT